MPVIFIKGRTNETVIDHGIVGSEDPLRFVYNYAPGYNGVHPAGLNYEIGHRRQGDRVQIHFTRSYLDGSVIETEPSELL